MSSAPDNAARKRRDTIFCLGLAALLAVLIVGWKSLLIRGVPGDLDSTALTIVMWALFGPGVAGSFSTWAATKPAKSIPTSNTLLGVDEEALRHVEQRSWMVVTGRSPSATSIDQLGGPSG